MPPTTAPIRAIETEIGAHAAMEELSRFGVLLEENPLDHDGLRTFFATMGAFFWDIPTGILALALRICDDWAAREPRDATAQGAYILFADVDEFGLHDQHQGLLPTHHQLFRELTGHLGISEEDLVDPRYVLSAGSALGSRTTQYYRHQTIAESLGFHLASETTSNREFRYFLRGFGAHPTHYGLQDEADPVLLFFKVHTIVEPMHKHRARQIIESYAQADPDFLAGVRAGAMAFMDGFDELFRAVNEAVFSVRHDDQALVGA